MPSHWLGAFCYAFQPPGYHLPAIANVACGYGRGLEGFAVPHILCMCGTFHEPPKYPDRRAAGTAGSCQKGRLFLIGPWTPRNHISFFVNYMIVGEGSSPSSALEQDVVARFQDLRTLVGLAIPAVDVALEMESLSKSPARHMPSPKSDMPSHFFLSPTKVFDEKGRLTFVTYT